MNILYLLHRFLKKLKSAFVLLSFFLLPGLLFASGDSPFSVELQAKKQQSGEPTITVVITNQSAEPLYLLKWNTPLESILSADVFDVQYNNRKITYIGRMIKRGAPTDKDFILMQSGEMISKTLKLHDYYLMDKQGGYKVAYKGQVRYKSGRLSKSAKPQTIQRSKVTGKTIELDFIPPAVDQQIQPKLPANYDSCTSSEITTLNNAHDAAIDISHTASEAMNNASVPTSAARYIEWFGVADIARHNIIKDNFTNILSALDTEQVTFSCACNENYFAYVYPSQPYTIYLCNAFWGAALTGTDSQAGTLVHETSHFTIVAGTDDHVYGQSGARALAISDPDSAVENADSHEYFAENTPFLLMSVAPEDYGDTKDDAHQLVLVNGSVSISSNIETGDDTDFFAFNAPVSGEVQVFTTGTLDTVGVLYEQDGTTELGNNDDFNGDSNFKIIKDISSGLHYVSVDSYAADTGYYTLQINVIPSFNGIPVINYLLD